ncbi:MAG: hypothetical protein U1E76_04045 [Planctomycetota bacterium]
MTWGGVTCGVEVELLVLDEQRAPGSRGRAPHRVLEVLRSTQPHVPYCGRDGAFFPQGLAYLEMGHLLEVASYPARTLDGVIACEDACLALVRAGLRAAFPGPRPRLAVCLADDLHGTPAGLMKYRPLADAFSSSVGTHVNLIVPPERLTAAARGWFAMLTAVLPEIVGPGGFTRAPASRGLVFWHDPRVAHVLTVESSRAHDRCGRPMFKSTTTPGRLQIVALGHVLARVDRTIKYGLLLLLAAAVARGEALPDLKLNDLIGALRLAPCKTLAGCHSALPFTATRLDVLERIIDLVLAPVASTAEGASLGCGQALEWAAQAIDACRRLPQEEVATRLPLEWALKHRLFRAMLGSGFHGRGERRRCPGPGSLALEEKAALLSVRAADVADDGVRRALLAQIEASSPWPFDDVYRVHPEAARCLAERRPPVQALSPAPELQLLTASPARAFFAGASWTQLWFGPVPHVLGTLPIAELPQRLARGADAVRQDLEAAVKPLPLEQQDAFRAFLRSMRRRHG